jgi:hypothetical protein
MAQSMSIEHVLDGAVADAGCWRPIASLGTVATRKGSRAGDVDAAQKKHVSDLNVDPRQQDFVLATEQLEQNGNSVTPRHVGIEG